MQQMAPQNSQEKLEPNKEGISEASTHAEIERLNIQIEARGGDATEAESARLVELSELLVGFAVDGEDFGTRYFPAFLELQSADLEKRGLHFQALQGSLSPHAERAFLEHLDRQTNLREVRIEVVKGLGYFSGKAVLTPLCEIFESPEEDLLVRIQVAQELATSHDDGAYDTLSEVGLSATALTTLFRGTCNALRVADTERAAKLLLSRIEPVTRVSTENAKSIRHALQQFSSPGAVKAIIEFGKHASLKLREDFAYVLAELNTPEAWDVLKSDYAQSKHKRVRAIAIDALRNEGSPETEAQIIEALQTDQAGLVRKYAAAALFNYGSSQALEALNEVILGLQPNGEPYSTPVRKEAVWALSGQPRSEKLRSILQTCLRDEEPEIREQADRSLSTLGMI